MALTGNITTDDGVDHVGAYARLGVLNLSFVDKKAHLVVFVYKDRAARDSGKRPAGTREYRVSADSTPSFDSAFSGAALVAMNPIRRIYMYLKTLPEWAGWVDSEGDFDPDNPNA